MNGITQSELKEKLDYDPSTGFFTWKVSPTNIVLAGDVAGCYGGGYIHIGIDGCIYKAHRLAWLYVHGYMPENQIDHINRKRDDNRIKNLREVSGQCNLRNTGNPRNNKSGVKGVSYDYSRNKWLARIKVSQKTYNLGRFDDFTEAVYHRCK